MDPGDRVKEEEIPMLLTNNSSYPSGSNASERKNILSHRRIILSIRLLDLTLCYLTHVSTHAQFTQICNCPDDAAK